MNSPANSPQYRNKTSWNLLWLLVGPLAFLSCFLLPFPTFNHEAGLIEASWKIRTAIGLAAWMALWWLGEVLPLAITSLLPLIVLPFSGVMPAGDSAAFYFSDTTALFFGGFCLALAMEKSALHQRITTKILKLFGTKPDRIVFGFFVLSALLSMWVSNTATSLMLLPIASTFIIQVLPTPEKRSSQENNLAKACILAVAFGASIGGIGTLIGTPPNAYFQGFFNQHYHKEIEAGLLQEITFGRWFMLGFPIVLCLVPLAWFLMTRFLLPLPKELAPKKQAHFLKREHEQSQEPISRDQKIIMLIFTLTLILWLSHKEMVFFGFTLPLTGWDSYFSNQGQAAFISDGSIVLIATLFLFILPSKNSDEKTTGPDQQDKKQRLLTWSFIRGRLPWDVLILFGGGFALAGSFEASGLNDYLKAAFSGLEGLSPLLSIAIILVSMTLLGELSSNTAAAATLLPVIASFASAIDHNPIYFLIAGTLGASCGYALPVATPPNAIALSSGQIKARDMLRAGIWLDLLAMLIMFGVVYWIAPHIF